MSLLQTLNDQNTPVISIDSELPWCVACGNYRATLSRVIGEVPYDLCVRCWIRAGLDEA